MNKTLTIVFTETNKWQYFDAQLPRKIRRITLVSFMIKPLSHTKILSR